MHSLQTATTNQVIALRYVLVESGNKICINRPRPAESIKKRKRRKVGYAIMYGTRIREKGKRMSCKILILCTYNIFYMFRALSNERIVTKARYFINRTLSIPTLTTNNFRGMSTFYENFLGIKSNILILPIARI